jgi:hypothetical protein
MASQPIYQFYAELDDYKPKMWRRFQVMNNITMARLGYIVMTLFEMQASHLFCFEVPFSENFRVCVGDRFGNEANSMAVDILNEHPELNAIHIELPNEDDLAIPGQRTMNAAETLVKHVVDHTGEALTFSYDYGDGWEIKLVLEQIIEDKALPGKELPRVLAGEGYGIVEDCGGAGGLEDIAKAFKKKKGKQYDEYRQWLSVDELDLAVFDIEDMNFRLKKVPRIYADAYEYGLEPTKQSMDLLTRKYLGK